MKTLLCYRKGVPVYKEEIRKPDLFEMLHEMEQELEQQRVDYEDRISELQEIISMYEEEYGIL